MQIRFLCLDVHAVAGHIDVDPRGVVHPKNGANDGSTTVVASHVVDFEVNHAALQWFVHTLSLASVGRSSAAAHLGTVRKGRA